MSALDIWVSVYKSANGPKLRKLAKKLNRCKAEALGALVLLWQWALENADSETGVVLSADEEDVGRYLYYEIGDDTLDANDIVLAMIDSGWIDRGEDGVQLIIHDWDEWQAPWRSYNARKKANRESKRKERAEKAAEAQNVSSENAERKLSNADTNQNRKEPAVKKSNKIEYSSAFGRLWEVYPRKDDKQIAYRKYSARIKDGYSEDELFEAVQNYATYVKKEVREKRYILMGKTFFEPEGRFTQYLPKKSNADNDVAQAVIDDGNPFSRFMEGGF